MNTPDSEKLAQCWSALYEGCGNFRQLGYELRQRFAFLRDLSPSPSNVVNFGCSAEWNSLTGYSGGLEPFALLWTLEADRIIVVDMNESSIDVLRRHVSELHKKYPHCFDGGLESFGYLVADMTVPEEIGKLPSEQFDLAYCSRVLLNIEHSGGLDGVRNAIEGIARVIKPCGWVVSHEAGARERYPTHYIEMFRKARLGRPRIIRVPESASTPTFEIEYAIYKKPA